MSYWKHCYLTCLTFIKILSVIIAENFDESLLKGDLPWTCSGQNQCEKVLRSKTNPNDTISWESCRMLCEASPPLWPKPKSVMVSNKKSTAFSKEHIFLKIFAPSEKVRLMLQEAANNFVQNLDEVPYTLLDKDEQIVKLRIHVNSPESKLTLQTKENYSLYVQTFEDDILINVYATNFFGARIALETLGQLIWFDTISRRLQILHDIKITDEPAFAHRGLMIDTARNFFPVSHIKKAINGMAFTKLNTLHLHLTDIESFPVVLPKHKEFAERGAYGKNMTYSAQDLKDIIKFANLRGIKVVLEIDAPSHVNAGWPKDTILCSDDRNHFSGLLNPDNDQTFSILRDIYEDLLDIGTDNEIFHIGGDEVNLNCWRNTNGAKEMDDIHTLWINVTKRIFAQVKNANSGTLPKNVVLWSSPLTDNYLLKLEPKENIVVQFWFGSYRQILSQGYKIIFSTVGNWYLDCGFGPWKMNQQSGACDPYTPWQKFYKYRPWRDTTDYLNQVLGGEVCLWSEEVSPDDLETRLWPRSAAFAERVWSDPKDFDELEVFKRFAFFTERLRKKGLEVAAIWPAWCTMYPEQCVNH